ncbi:hypothetical protein HYU92_02110 [Candidatus Curtissbacteria bacterium]|nr:hypothetical protein [Candidatus Curtissbacteria bacterium]
MTRLRNRPTDLDDRRGVVTWRRSSIYFHALQDLRLVDFARRAHDGEEGKELPELVQNAQACFVKDFDIYFAGFPKEETAMSSLFQEIFDTGTSFEWQNDLERVEGLEEAFSELYREQIRPWVALEK